jgi:hypothetical protein
MAGTWFAVGRPHGHRSALWQLWTRGSSAYVLHSGTRGTSHRFSFSHRSTACRWVELNPARPGERRTILEWARDPVPPPGSSSGCLLMAAIFPTNQLAPAEAPTQDAVHWIDPAPPHWAIRLEFVIALQPQPEAGNPLRLRPDQRLLFSTPLWNGSCVSVIASTFDCGPVELRLPQRPTEPGQVLGAIDFQSHAGHAVERPIRALILGSNVHPPDIWELGGYKATRW